MKVLTPAYGRVYTTREKVENDYLNGKDFILNDPSSQWNGRYCSIRDFEGETVELRYGERLQHFTYVKYEV